MMDVEALRTLIETARKRLSDLERQADTLRIELRAYERAAAVLTGVPVAVVESRGGGSRRRRGLSTQWRDIFGWIGRQGAAPDTEGIWHYVEHAHPQVTRNTLRSQLSVYTEKGLLLREDGRYSLSAAGVDATHGSDLDDLPETDEAATPITEIAA